MTDLSANYDASSSTRKPPSSSSNGTGNNGQHDPSPPETDWNAVEEFLSRWYDETPGTYELLILPRGEGRPRPWLSYADSARSAGILLKTSLSQLGTVAGCYIGLNPLKRVPKGSTLNAVFQMQDTRAKETDVERRRRVLLDFDAVKAAGGMATAAERAKAVAARDATQELLNSLGWPAPRHITSSGSGAGLIYEADLPVSNANSSYVARALKGICAHLVDTKTKAKLDISVHDAPRVTKIPGTLVAKGEHTTERPWFVATEAEQTAPRQALTQDNLKAAGYLERNGPAPGAVAELQAKVEAALRSLGISVTAVKPQSYGVVLKLDKCLIADPAHSSDGGGPYIVITPVGLSIKCYADRCNGSPIYGEAAVQLLGIEVPELIRRGADSTLPRLDAGKLIKDLAPPAWGALVDANANLEQPKLVAGDKGLVRLAWGDTGFKHRELKEEMRPKLDAISFRLPPPGVSAVDLLGHELRRTVQFYERRTSAGVAVQEDCEPGMALIKDMLASGPPAGLPPYLARQTAPMFLPSGELLTDRRLHRETGTALDLDPEFDGMPAVPKQPTAEQVRASLAALLDRLADFRLIDGSSHGNALAYMLTPYVRAIIDSYCPICAIGAPQPKAGKTRLAQTIFGPGLGVYTLTGFRSNDEVGKMIAAAYLAGDWFIGFDNVAGTLDSPELASATTQRRGRARLLTTNDYITGPPSAVIVVTGNKFEFSEELASRSAHMRIGVYEADPAARRAFKFPMGWVKAATTDRALLTWHCLVLIQNWFAKEAPAPTWTMNRYEEWSRVVFGVLEAAGYEPHRDDGMGYADGAVDAQASALPTDTDDFLTLLKRWWIAYGSTEIQTKAVDALAEGEVPGQPEWERLDDIERPQSFGPEDPLKRRQALGKWLRKEKSDRTFAIEDGQKRSIEVRLAQAKAGGSTAGGARWQLTLSRAPEWANPFKEPGTSDQSDRSNPKQPSESGEDTTKNEKVKSSSHTYRVEKTSIDPIDPIVILPGDGPAAPAMSFGGMLDEGDNDD